MPLQLLDEFRLTFEEFFVDNALQSLYIYKASLKVVYILRIMVFMFFCILHSITLTFQINNSARMKKASRSQWLIKGSSSRKGPLESMSRLQSDRSQHLTDYRLRVQESRAEKSIMNQDCSNPRTKRIMGKLEQQIFALQDKAMDISEQIEVEKEKEAYLDLQIEELSKKVSDLRLKKPEQGEQGLEATSTGQGFFRGTFASGQTAENEAMQVNKVNQLKQRIKKTKNRYHETKARNIQLRLKIDHLR